MLIIRRFKTAHDTYKPRLKIGKVFPLPLFHRALHGAKIRACNVLWYGDEESIKAIETT